MAKVIHFTPCSDKSTMASAKIAKWIAKTVKDCERVDSGRVKPVPVDVLFVVNGPWAFCDFREQVVEWVKLAHHVVWVQNDYNIEVPSPIKKVLTEDMKVLSTLAGEGITSQYVNWNQLTFQPLAESRIGFVPGLYYHGAFRKGREKYFRRYFDKAGYPVTISTTVRAATHFRQTCRGNNVTIIPPFRSLAEMAPYQAALYIEDEESHKVYCSPANRFYEYLSAGVPIIFDESCIPTFRTYGLDISAWTVHKGSELMELMEEWRDIRDDQRRLWAGKDYAGKLYQEFFHACEALALPVRMSQCITSAKTAPRKGFLN